MDYSCMIEWFKCALDGLFMYDLICNGCAQGSKETSQIWEIWKFIEHEWSVYGCVLNNVIFLVIMMVWFDYAYSDMCFWE